MVHKKRRMGHANPLGKRVKALAAVMAALLLALPFSARPAAAGGLDDISLIQMIYHVKVNGVELGTVEDKTAVKELIETMVGQAELKHPGLEFAIVEHVTYEPDRMFRPNPSTEQTLHRLRENLTIKAEAVKLSVGGESVGYVKNRETAQKILKQYKLKYIPKTILEELNDGNVTKIELKDGTAILDVHLSKDVSLEYAKVAPNKLLSVDKALKKLANGTKEIKTYVVKKGDVPISIAKRFGLTLEELTALNPQMGEDEVLNVGEELKVTAPVPFVKVVVEKAKVTKKGIPYDTKVKKDDSMFKGESEVIREGDEGVKKVRYIMIVENGELVDKKVDKVTVLEPPTEKVVARGTKVIPSRGTGSFIWPAIGGYISSYMGPRWGSFHKGIDIAGPSNRAILAADNGTVEYAGWNDGGYGYRIIIDHNNGLKTTYNHLASILVHVGETVRKGEQIGVMGATGHVTGVHLHFEVYKNGHLVNPMDYLN